jgi:ATP-dependent helicase/nuclease subunit A
VNGGPETPHAADANQARASDPSASAWVSANAGTGKTEVLVRRVLRLLLAGFEPQRILCLTYTKMAAAEMQNRLLGDLAAWATTDEGELGERLKRVLSREPDGTELQAARRLFARTLEAKGGLKIFTIHAFCERLLQRFPLEAGVTPHFTVLEESEAVRLKAEAFDAVMAHAAAEREGPLGRGRRLPQDHRCRSRRTRRDCPHDRAARRRRRLDARGSDKSKASVRA